MSRHAVDLFAGCGGASLGLHRAGYEVIGVEVWEDAVRSHEAAGLPCSLVDVRLLDPKQFAGVDHLHGSPPCTTFSKAGSGAGRRHLLDIAEAVKRVLHGEPHGLDDPDETTLLTLEPARYLAEIRPDTVSLEQVREVLPIWGAYATGLEDLGYSVATGLISSETLGVPQSRARAWLAARRDGNEARLPKPTHSALKTPDVALPDPVGMKEALGPEFASEWHFVAAAGLTGDVCRSTALPAPTITGAGTAYLIRDRSEYPGRGAKPGTYEKNGRRLTVAESLVLQGFPADYPLVGRQGSRTQQVGNAVPPAVAEAVVRTLVER